MFLSPVSVLKTTTKELEALSVLARRGLLDPRVLTPITRAALHWRSPMVAPFVAGASRFASRTALVDDAGALTFGEVDDRTNALANGYRGIGLDSQDRVGVLCRNHRGFVEAILALGKIGTDAVLLNTGFAGPQLAEVCMREGVTALVVDGESVEVAEEAAQGRVLVVAEEKAPSGQHCHGSLIASGASTQPPAPKRTGGLVLMTSGTTGLPKGAHRSAALRAPSSIAGLLSLIPYRHGGTSVVSAPLFHAWGLGQLGVAAMFGNTLVLRRRFDPEEVLADVEAHQARTLVAVPVMLQRILDLPSAVLGSYDTSSLTSVLSGGSALGAPLARAWMETFGENLYNFYGSTEVAQVSVASPKDLREAPGTVGRIPVGTRVKLFDDDGRRVPTGEIGRIFAGSSNTFVGYTGGGGREQIDGLTATGDLGRFDEAGRLFVVGRADDMIVSGAENVYPGEIEELLQSHPAVAEVVVVGVSDDEFGQRLRAVVVRRAGSAVEEEELRSYVREHLAGFKVPREVVFMEELPRNATGKILKRELVG